MTESMEIRPMIFDPPMVKAILEGHKTVTRRLTNLRDQSVVKAGPKTLASLGRPLVARCPPCCDGDILWVREKWGRYLDLSSGKPTWRYAYFADGEERVPIGVDEDGREYTSPVNWRPSIHMPKDAARLFLRVCSVRVVRLRDITGDMDELEREGINIAAGMIGASAFFADLWDSLLKPTDLAKYGWDANPWVWRIEFRRCEKPDGWPGGGA